MNGWQGLKQSRRNALIVRAESGKNKEVKQMQIKYDRKGRLMFIGGKAKVKDIREKGLIAASIENEE